MNKKILLYIGLGLLIIIGGLYIYSIRKKPINQINQINQKAQLNSSNTDTPEWSASK